FPISTGTLRLRRRMSHLLPIAAVAVVDQGGGIEDRRGDEYARVPSLLCGDRAPPAPPCITVARTCFIPCHCNFSNTNATAPQARMMPLSTFLAVRKIGRAHV